MYEFKLNSSFSGSALTSAAAGGPYRQRSRRSPLAKQIFVIVFAVLLFGHSMPATTHAACNPQFTQVNEDGFGDPLNVYMWSLRVFNGHLYAGTGHIAAVQPALPGSAELWRYDGTTWVQVMDDGFGNSNNTGIRDLHIYDGRLYAATVNEIDGAEIWRSSDGLNWERVVSGGFGTVGNEAVRSLETYRRRLYAGVQNTASGPGQLWRSFNGKFWTPIALNGFGFPNNSSVHVVSQQFLRLYAGVRNTESGAQVWRSGNGTSWDIIVGPTASTPSGFGNPNNVLVFHFHRFKGAVYVGTANVVDGFAVYRTVDGINFAQVGQFGFGNSNNIYAWRFHTFEDAMWLGVANDNFFVEGASLWRTFDGDNWEEMAGADGTHAGYGFDDVKNWGVRAFETFNDELYIATAQCPFGNCSQLITGGEIWKWPGESCP